VEKPLYLLSNGKNRGFAGFACKTFFFFHVGEWRVYQISAFKWEGSASRAGGDLRCCGTQQLGRKGTRNRLPGAGRARPLYFWMRYISLALLLFCSNVCFLFHIKSFKNKKEIEKEADSGHLVVC
jgi:hypothetical protein